MATNDVSSLTLDEVYKLFIETSPLVYGSNRVIAAALILIAKELEHLRIAMKYGD